MSRFKMPKGRPRDPDLTPTNPDNINKIKYHHDTEIFTAATSLRFPYTWGANRKMPPPLLLASLISAPPHLEPKL